LGQEYNYRKDELLEILWHLHECHSLNLGSLREHDADNLFEGYLSKLSSSGLIKMDGDEIIFTKAGETSAKAIVRGHRLAERLMVDVLGKKVEDTEQAACEFEHILDPGIVDSICILLGHPRQCPHGALIPEGKCCVDLKNSTKSIVTSLSELKAGTSAKVAFISSKDNERMHRLLSLGFTPGTKIKVQQKSPTLVLEIAQSQIAIDSDVGNDIKVWVS